MSYQIHYLRKASKYILRLTPTKCLSVLAKIESVAKDPLLPNNNISKLTGTKSSYRLRIGDIRVIYELDIPEKIMYVVKISPRGSAYSQ